MGGDESVDVLRRLVNRFVPLYREALLSLQTTRSLVHIACGLVSAVSQLRDDGHGAPAHVLAAALIDLDAVTSGRPEAQAAVRTALAQIDLTTA